MKLLRLYRVDAALICFLTYIFGESLGTGEMNYTTLLNASLLSLLSTYSN